MKEKLQSLWTWLENSRYAPLLQFVKFGLVGVSSTLISYTIEMICYYGLFRNATFSGIIGLLGGFGLTVTTEQVKVVFTTLLAFIVSVTNSYLLNSRFVFRAEEKPSFAQSMKVYGKTVLCYALTGIFLAPVLRLWLGGLGIPYWAASLMSLIVTIPLNFIMNKFWAYAGRK